MKPYYPMSRLTAALLTGINVFDAAETAKNPAADILTAIELGWNGKADIQTLLSTRCRDNWAVLAVLAGHWPALNLDVDEGRMLWKTAMDLCPPGSGWPFQAYPVLWGLASLPEPMGTGARRALWRCLVESN